MDQLGPILDLMAAGGDTAAIVLVFVMWRFDRRMLKMEIHLFGGNHGKSEGK